MPFIVDILKDFFHKTVSAFFLQIWESSTFLLKIEGKYFVCCKKVENTKIWIIIMWSDLK